MELRPATEGSPELGGGPATACRRACILYWKEKAASTDKHKADLKPASGRKRDDRKASGERPKKAGEKA
jgi:hypothetical protein